MKNFFRSRKIVPLSRLPSPRKSKGKRTRSFGKRKKRRRLFSKQKSMGLILARRNEPVFTHLPRKIQRSPSGGWTSQMHINHCVDLRDLKRIRSDEEEMNSKNYMFNRKKDDDPKDVFDRSFQKALKKNYVRHYEKTSPPLSEDSNPSFDSFPKVRFSNSSPSPKNSPRGRPNNFTHSHSYYDEDVEICSEDMILQKSNSGGSSGLMGFEDRDNYPVQLAKLEEKLHKQKVIPLSNECNNCFEKCHKNRKIKEKEKLENFYCDVCACDECCWRKVFAMSESVNVEADYSTLLKLIPLCCSDSSYIFNNICGSDADFENLCENSCTMCESVERCKEISCFRIIFFRAFLPPFLVFLISIFVGLALAYFKEIIEGNSNVFYFWLFSGILILSSLVNILYFSLDISYTLLKGTSFLNQDEIRRDQTCFFIWFFVEIFLAVVTIVQIIILLFYLCCFIFFMMDIPFSILNYLSYHIKILPPVIVQFDYIVLILSLYMIFSLILYYFCQVGDVNYWKNFSNPFKKKCTKKEACLYINSLQKSNPALEMSVEESYSITGSSSYSLIGVERRKNMKKALCKFDFVKDYTIVIDESYLESEKKFKPIMVINIHKVFFLSNKSHTYVDEMVDVMNSRSRYVSKTSESVSFNEFKKDLLLFGDGDKDSIPFYDKLVIYQNSCGFCYIFRILFSKCFSSTIVPFLVHPLILKVLKYLLVENKDFYVCKGVYSYKSVVTRKKAMEIGNTIHVEPI